MLSETPQSETFVEHLEMVQKEIGTRFTIAVSELIRYFPGVHLYSLCRTVPSECEEEAAKRRQVSPL